MEFKKEIEVSKILIGNKIEENVVEIRYDPLTLQTSRIVSKIPPISTQGDFNDEIENSKSYCPFCNERVWDLAVKDVEIMNGEIMKKDEALLFSNLTPYSKYSFILRLCNAHYLHLNEFRVEHFKNGLTLIQECLKKLPEGKFYISIGMNYLKPAGSSVMHPHMQIIISETSTDYFARLDWSALEYNEINGKDFWQALVEKEKEIGQRYVGETKKTEWLAAYAPKGFMHFIGIPEEKEFLKMDEEQIEGICDGIVKVLNYYHSKQFNSFNMSIFCGDRIGEHFRTNVNIVARTPFEKYYWCDVFFPKIFHDESVVHTFPEVCAKELKLMW
ncbi:hypothetical protein DRP05_03735 [Archaeoglobales archaeon]|nr:MAG: hypothetical protein DRP05_03735 [Archaeoglobales archaeon]